MIIASNRWECITCRLGLGRGRLHLLEPAPDGPWRQGTADQQGGELGGWRADGRGAWPVPWLALTRRRTAVGGWLLPDTLPLLGIDHLPAFVEGEQVLLECGLVVTKGGVDTLLPAKVVHHPGSVSQPVLRQPLECLTAVGAELYTMMRQDEESVRDIAAALPDLGDSVLLDDVARQTQRRWCGGPVAGRNASRLRGVTQYQLPVPKSLEDWLRLHSCKYTKKIQV